MGFLDEYADPQFGGSRRAKGQPSKSSRRQLRRVASQAPEVMVKITGYSYNKKQMGSHMDYLSRKGTLSVFTDDGRVIEGRAAIAQVAGDWMENARTKGRRHTRAATKLALSMPRGNPKRVLAAAQDFAQKEFSNHEWVMALHTDTDHPHVHLTIRNRGKDGKRLHIPKGRTQEWRESFAASLRSHGVEAEATRRAERGVVRTGESQTVRHIRAKTSKPTATDKSAMRQADASRRGVGRSEPWRKQIEERQNQVRAQWRKAIESERTNGSPELADIATRFLENMPPVETRNDQMVAFIRERMTQKAHQEHTGADPTNGDKQSTTTTRPNRFHQFENEADGPER